MRNSFKSLPNITRNLNQLYNLNVEALLNIQYVINQSIYITIK